MSPAHQRPKNSLLMQGHTGFLHHMTQSHKTFPSWRHDINMSGIFWAHYKESNVSGSLSVSYWHKGTWGTPPKTFPRDIMYTSIKTFNGHMSQGRQCFRAHIVSFWAWWRDLSGPETLIFWWHYVHTSSHNKSTERDPEMVLKCWFAHVHHVMGQSKVFWTRHKECNILRPPRVLHVSYGAR